MRVPAAWAWTPRSRASAGSVSFQPPSMWSGPCGPVVAVMRSGFNRAISGYRSGSPRKRSAMYHNQSPCLTSYVGAAVGVVAVAYATGVIAGAGMRTVQPGERRGGPGGGGGPAGLLGADVAGGGGWPPGFFPREGGAGGGQLFAGAPPRA